MDSRQTLLQCLDCDPDICTHGYAFADLDPKGYRLWVIDCARHVLPIAEQHLSADEAAILASALDTAIDHIEGRGMDEQVVSDAVAIPLQIATAQCDRYGEIRCDIAESLDAISNAVAMANPGSNVYHEDVVYAAARAAYAADSYGSGNDEQTTRPELAGSEESTKEILWQVDALRRRLLSI